MLPVVYRPAGVEVKRMLMTTTMTNDDNEAIAAAAVSGRDARRDARRDAIGGNWKWAESATRSAARRPTLCIHVDETNKCWSVGADSIASSLCPLRVHRSSSSGGCIRPEGFHDDVKERSIHRLSFYMCRTPARGVESGRPGFESPLRFASLRFTCTSAPPPCLLLPLLVSCSRPSRSTSTSTTH
jgi:hypothetical protein